MKIKEHELKHQLNSMAGKHNKQRDTMTRENAQPWQIENAHVE